MHTTNDIPDHLRQPPGLYPYLAAMPDYWRHAMDVAHRLLDQHEAASPNATYYQDNFGDDYINALEFDGIARPLVVTSIHEVTSCLNSSARKDNPDWCAYSAALEELKALPRGTQILVRKIYEGGDHWEAKINAGAGYINGCSTMQRFKEQPGPEEAVKTLLRYEAYLARQQAQKERLILANYGRIKELGLVPGMRLREVRALHNGRTRSFSFDISAVHDNGTLRLVNGKLRGSRATFDTTKEACEISAENLDINNVRVA